MYFGNVLEHKCFPKKGVIYTNQKNFCYLVRDRFLSEKLQYYIHNQNYTLLFKCSIVFHHKSNSFTYLHRSKNIFFSKLEVKYLQRKKPHQWCSCSTSKAGRWEVPSSIPGRSRRINRSKFSVVFSETRINTGWSLLERPLPRRVLPLQAQVPQADN